jgi:zinc protease
MTASGFAGVGSLAVTSLRSPVNNIRFRLAVAVLIAALASAGRGLGQTKAEAGSEDKARRTLAHAQQAVGGRAKLESIRDITRTAELVQPEGGTKPRQVLRIITPRVIHLMSEMGPGMKITAFFDGTRSWATSPWGTDDPLPAWQAQAAAQDLFRQLELLLLSDRDPERTLDSFERTEVQGKPAESVRIVDKNAGEVKLWVDAASGEPLQIEYRRIVARGQAPVVIDRFSDFRDVGGIRTPFKISTVSDGVPYMDTTVAKVEYNTGLTLADLAKKDERAAPAH